MTGQLETPHIVRMDEMLEEARGGKNGLKGVRLFVRDGNDSTLEDIAHAFCVMEQGRRDGKFKLVAFADPS